MIRRSILVRGTPTTSALVLRPWPSDAQRRPDPFCQAIVDDALPLELPRTDQDVGVVGSFDFVRLSARGRAAA